MQGNASGQAAHAGQIKAQVTRATTKAQKPEPHHKRKGPTHPERVDTGAELDAVLLPAIVPNEPRQTEELLMRFLVHSKENSLLATLPGRADPASHSHFGRSPSDVIQPS